MKPPDICIVGGRGKMGSCFAKKFRDIGCSVEIVDIHDSNSEFARKIASAKIVIVSVPIRTTNEVLKSILLHISQDALLTDFTSIKVEPMNIMHKHTGEVMGGHPLFGPSVSLKGQSMIVCNQGQGELSTWYINALKSLGLEVHTMTAKEHDAHMGVIQCMTHLSNLSLVYTLKKLDVDLKKTLEITSPVYKLRLFTAARMLAQSAELYTDIQMNNMMGNEVVAEYEKSVHELHVAITNTDTEAFQKIFNETKSFCKDFADVSMHMTNKFIEVL